jgi:5'(3')-deoxyribonucleotidase
VNHPYVAGFDIDGVIADFVTSFRGTVRDKYGVELREEQIRGHDLSLALGIGHGELSPLVRTTLERRNPNLYPKAAEGLAQLVTAGLEVHIITARWNGDPDGLPQIEQWLGERGLQKGVHYHRIDAVREGAKHGLAARLDCFVDDNLMELIEMADQRPDVPTLIVYDHPWNQTADVHGRYCRVTDWPELVALILADRDARLPAS